MIDEEHQVLVKPFNIAFVFVALLLLSACQEIQGPTWSSDGKWIAHTVYSHPPKNRDGSTGGLHTAIYLTAPDSEDSAPKFLADNAAFPHFATNSSQLFFLGARDTKGYYTKIMRLTLGNAVPEVALGGVRLTAMQLATGNNGPLLLLMQGQDPSPGASGTLELWSANDGKRTALTTLGDVTGPAISPNGKIIIYGSKPAEGHPILMAAEIGATTEAKAIFPTATQTEPGASSFIVHAFPAGDRFLFYGPGLKNVWTLSGKPGANKFVKFPIPDGLSSPVMARVAPDGNTAAMTFMRAVPGRIAYESYKLDINQSRWTKLDENADEPIGGISPDPKAAKAPGARMAWLSAAGLTIGDAAKPISFPVTAAQHLAASTAFVKANQPDKAVELALKAQDLVPPPDADALNQTLYAAYIAAKRFDRAADLFEQSWLLEPVGSSGINYIFPPDSGLPSPSPEWVAAQLKRITELTAGAPDNRMLPLLKKAFLARQTGAHRDALDAYRKALDYCPDKARVAGVRFQQGVCELEWGDAFQAADFFEQAAKIEDFPQADLAAGLSAMALLLHGRKESAAKAASLLQLPVVRKSPFAAELAIIPALVKGKNFKDHGATPEAATPDDTVHAWAEYDTFWMPFVSTKPIGMDLGDGTYSLRRIGLKRVTASSILTNKQTTPILKIARPVTAPKLSPNGQALAFTISGEVPPVADTFCELMVLDLTGGVYNGDPIAAAKGLIRSRQVLTQFAWKGPSEITLTGATIDLFGGQKPFVKPVPLGRLMPKK
ncbi:MAG: tetratricopeptide repeat protein [Planctomycetota bacterium]